MILFTHTLVLVDLNGTLVETKSGAQFAERLDDWKLLPRRLEYLEILKSQGKKIAIVTNQGGAAFGYFTPVAMGEELFRIRDTLHLDGFYVSYTHPQGTIPILAREDQDRKPNPGMLIRAMRDFAVAPDLTIMVGDRDEDQEAARRAGVSFRWAKDFFDDDVQG